jgi:hypothetical protein
MKKTDGATEKAMISSNQENTVLFWLCASLIALLSTTILFREIDRPFWGLHSWGESHAAWVARSHIVYGLGYTKGFDTFAVGNPPEEKPTRYLDHPQGRTWLDAIAMLIIGTNELAIRIPNLIATFLTVLIFIKILKALTDYRVALLAGFFFATFPLTGYFGVWGVSTWFTPTAMLTIWYYLVVTGIVPQQDGPRKRHKWILAFLLFLILQMTWEGFFVALAVGVHFICRQIKKKKFPHRTILAILIIAPLSSLLLNFLILSAGRGWNFHEIIEIAKWRATSGEMENLTWAGWFELFKIHAVTNFTIPALVLTILALTLGQLYILLTAAKTTGSENKYKYKFPQFWLFTLPAVFQLLILRGALVPHQYWERPIAFPIAIALALAVMIIYDLLRRLNEKVAVVSAAAVTLLVFIFCMVGTNYYYSYRWQPEQKIKMFKELNQKIPPDKYLLSYEGLMYDQHEYKAASIQCEIAWYLDRQIHTAQTLNEVLEKAKTGKYPYYLIPNMPQLAPLIKELRKRYAFEYVPGQQRISTRQGFTYKGGMPPYLIFDLNSTAEQQ